MRGRYFMPQSGAATRRVGGDDGEPGAQAGGDRVGGFDFGDAEVEDAEEDGLVATAL